MRLLAAVVLAALAAACEKPVGEAAVGEDVMGIHIKDARTGRCVRISGGGKYTRFTRVIDSACDPVTR